MITSYALDAIDLAGRGNRSQAKEPETGKWIEGIKELPLSARPSLDLGVDVRFENEQVFGSGLLNEDNRHLSQGLWKI